MVCVMFPPLISMRTGSFAEDLDTPHSKGDDDVGAVCVPVFLCLCVLVLCLSVCLDVCSLCS